jgi:hypothetical protein
VNNLKSSLFIALSLLALMAAALAVPTGSLADAPRGFTPTYTPTLPAPPTATPTSVPQPAPTTSGPVWPTATPTPGPLLPETGEGPTIDLSLILAVGVMLVLALPLVVLARSTSAERRLHPARARDTSEH